MQGLGRGLTALGPTHRGPGLRPQAVEVPLRWGERRDTLRAAQPYRDELIGKRWEMMRWLLAYIPAGSRWAKLVAFLASGSVAEGEVAPIRGSCSTSQGLGSEESSEVELGAGGAAGGGWARPHPPTELFSLRGPVARGHASGRA